MSGEQGRDAQMPVSHVPGCKCETHDAPFLNVRDQTCIEWTAIMQRWLADLIAQAEQRGRVEALREAADLRYLPGDTKGAVGTPHRSVAESYARWLRERADRIEGA